MLQTSDKLIPPDFIRYATMIVTLEREVEELSVTQRIVDEKRRETLSKILDIKLRILTVQSSAMAEIICLQNHFSFTS
ncbi:hypothetical protein P8452_17285 [Trifolium repens]|nr:hypothetical protein P8452_17285 [Trifolium repens]